MNLIIVLFAKYIIFAVAFFVCVYLFTLYGNTKKFYKTVFIVFSSAVFAWVVAHIIKDIVKHPRPDQLLSLVQDKTYSFPSGHTTFISSLGYMVLSINKKVSYAIIGLALVVGFSRIMAGVHYWYDILGGLVLGLFLGYIITIFLKKFIK